MGKKSIPNDNLNSSFLSKNILGILLIILLVGISIAIFILVFYRLYFPGQVLSDHSKWGEFGDFFGGILNPSFAFLALLALFITIIIQSRQLTISTKELFASVEILKEQSKAITLQNFESAFFQMIHLHNDIVKDIYLEDPDSEDGKLLGRDCFKTLYEYEFKNDYEECFRKIKNHDEISIIDSSYDIFFQKYQAKVGHYFRNLYTIIKFIDQSDIENKKFYADIVRSQLSSFELILLFYNCLWRGGREKFKELIESYEFFEDMNQSELINPDIHIRLYGRKDYGDS
jgi:hypothetical protein